MVEIILLLSDSRVAVGINSVSDKENSDGIAYVNRIQFFLAISLVRIMSG